MKRSHVTLFPLLVLIVGGLLAGCASSRKAAEPALSPNGNWDYVIANTPQGDARGTIAINDEEDGLSGEMYVDILSQSAPVRDVAFQDSMLTFNVSFDADGQVIDCKADMKLLGDTMEGNFDVAGFGIFKLTASRVTEQE